MERKLQEAPCPNKDRACMDCEGDREVSTSNLSNGYPKISGTNANLLGHLIILIRARRRKKMSNLAQLLIITLAATA